MNRPPREDTAARMEMARDPAPAEPLVDTGKHGVLEGYAIAEGNQPQVNEGETPEAADELGQGEITDHCQEDRRNQQVPVAEFVDQPAGKGTLQSSFGAGQRKNQVGLCLADTERIANGRDKDSESPEENAAGEERHPGGDDHHPPAVVNAGTIGLLLCLHQDWLPLLAGNRCQKRDPPQEAGRREVTTN